MTIQDMVSNMPRNRGLHDRDAKRADIVGVAREMFVSDGFERTSISRLAKAVGITPNTLYWYFKDKDDILVAVLALIAAEDATDYAAVADRPLGERLAWLVDRLQRRRARPPHEVGGAVHARRLPVARVGGGRLRRGHDVAPLEVLA